MDTYGDLVTLLLTFFVLLYAMSSMDASKWKAMASAFNTRATVVEETENSQDGDPAETEKITQVTEFNELYEYMNQYIQENGLSDTIKIYGGDGYAFIVFQNSVFFDADSAVLKNEAKTILDYLATGLAGIPDQIGEVIVCGHTAQTWEDVQGETQAIIFDRQLSAERATQVVLYMQFKMFLTRASWWRKATASTDRSSRMTGRRRHAFKTEGLKYI
jgi:chemotaxis protein MotB